MGATEFLHYYNVNVSRGVCYLFKASEQVLELFVTKGFQKISTGQYSPSFQPQPTLAVPTCRGYAVKRKQ